MFHARILAVLCLPPVVGLVGCAEPVASETPAQPPVVAKPEQPKAKPVASKPKPQPIAEAPAPQPKETASPVVDPEAEKQRFVNNQSRRAYEAMSENTKAAADKIRLKIESAGIWSLDDDEVDFTFKHRPYFQPYVALGLTQNRPAVRVGEFADKLGLKSINDRSRLYKLTSIERANAMLLLQDIEQQRPLDADRRETLRIIADALPELMDYYIKHKPN